MIQLGRGKVISKKDLAAIPGNYPVYSSAKENDGKFGEYGEYMFDEELVTWSVDGGGRLFHRPRHRFSITNVGGFVRILDTSRIDCRYMFYALSFLHGQTTFDWVRKAHPSVIRKVYTDFPLPPLEEQKRIVAVLDQSFAALDRARANAKANLADAEELLALATDALCAKTGDDWIVGPMGDHCSFEGGYAFKSGDAVDGSSVQIVRIGNLYKNVLDLDRKPAFYPSSFADEYSRFRLQSGDIILSLTGTVGKQDYGFAVEVPETERTLLLNQRVARISPKDKDRLSSRFLLRLLRSKSFLSRLYKISRGTRQANLSTKDIAGLEIALPPLSKQQEIVDQLQVIDSQTKTLNSSYQDQSADLEDLRQSILQKAFAGELT